MVWIQAPENVKRIDPEPLDAPPEFNEPIEFNDSGTCNVTEPIAEYLINDYGMDIERTTEETDNE